MLERQTTWIEDEDEDEDDEEEEDGNQEQQQPAKVEPVDNGQPAESQKPHPDPIAGFCGRCGKIADTCYCFWNVGALKVRKFQRILASH